MTQTIATEIGPRAGIVGAIALRAIGRGIGLSLAVGDGAADDGARRETAEDGGTRAVVAVMVPVMTVMVPMPMSMPMPVLHLLHA